MEATKNILKTKTCKLCKKEFTRYNTIQKYCIKCTLKTIKEKKKEKTAKLKSVVENTVKYWRDKAWTEISKSIRYSDLKEIEGELKGQCYTCGRWHIPQKLHAGHFKHRKLDDDPMNVKKQCEYCNKHLHGNLAEYHLKLIEEYGPEEIEKLILRAETEQPKTWVEWKEIYLKYKELNRESCI